MDRRDVERCDGCGAALGDAVGSLTPPDGGVLVLCLDCYERARNSDRELRRIHGIKYREQGRSAN